MGKTALFVAAIFLALATGCQQDARSPAARGYSPLPSQAVFPQQQYHSGGMPVGGPVRLAPAFIPPVAGTSTPNVEWPLTLDDALAIAGQNSTIVRVLDGGEVGIHPVTGYDPPIAAEAANAAVGAFDVSFGANFYFNRINQPPDSFFGPGIPEDTRRDEASFTPGLSKLWSTGTETRVTYNPPTGYLFFPYGTDGFNPTHTADMEFLIRQPLLRGMGLEVNRAPMTVARLRADQTDWEFKRAVLAFVRSIEEGYWQLQAARVALAVIDGQLPLIEEVVRVEQAGLEAQRSVPADVAKARAQLHAFRQRQIAAQRRVIEEELRLRNLLGLEPHDNHTLVPTSVPSRAGVSIDFAASMQAALDNRPDLVQRRLALRIRELELNVANNAKLPQFDAFALYRMSGVAEELGDALEMMAGTRYHDWQFGVAFSTPLGRTSAKANLRAAQLRLEKEHAMLREAIHATAHQLGDGVCRVDYVYRQYAEAESRVRESRVWLQGAKVRYQNPPPVRGTENWLLLALDDYLQAMRSTADAEIEASGLLARFNIELARLEEIQGTLLTSSRIQIWNDPCARLPTRRLPPVELEASPFNSEGPAGPMAQPAPPFQEEIPPEFPGGQPW